MKFPGLCINFIPRGLFPAREEWVEMQKAKQSATMSACLFPAREEWVEIA